MHSEASRAAFTIALFGAILAMVATGYLGHPLPFTPF